VDILYYTYSAFNSSRPMVDINALHCNISNRFTMQKHVTQMTNTDLGTVASISQA